MSLHWSSSKDNKKLIKTLKKLRDLGNSVIVVEHDEETIRASDYIIDIGLEAGINGGNVIAEGTLDQLIKNKKSITAKYLSSELDVKVSKKRKLELKNFIQIKGPKGNNLKNINIKFPLNNFICIPGVSGGGKSSLIIETLYKALSKKINNSNLKSLPFDSLVGDELVDKIIEIDQSPIGRTP